MCAEAESAVSLLAADFPAVAFVLVVLPAIAVPLEHVAALAAASALDVAAQVLADARGPHPVGRLAGVQPLVVAPLAAFAPDVAALLLADAPGPHPVGRFAGVRPLVAAAVWLGPLLVWPAVAAAPANAGAQAQSWRWQVTPAFAVLGYR